MTTVTILLSTFNGEKYLKEQIDSLFSQKDVRVFVLARDDGSNDSTIQILDQYKKEKSNFDYYTNNNIGPAKSFLDLVNNAPKSEYYAFCDQDDVWDSDKLICAINQLEIFNQNIPNLYYSNLRVVDQNLQFFRYAHDRWFFNDNKYSALAENLCTGCTAVFNFKAKELMKFAKPQYVSMHDTWLYMICKLLGNTVYDEKPHISYRQHGNNVIGADLNKKKWKIIKQRFARIFARELQPRYKNAVSFNECFRDECSENDKKKLDKIVNYKNDIISRIKLLCDKEINASTFYGRIRFKLHVLWGTV